MARKRRRSNSMLGPMLGVIGVGVSSAVVAGSGATGATKTVLDAVPAMQAVGVLKKASKSKWF